MALSASETYDLLEKLRQGEVVSTRVRFEGFDEATMIVVGDTLGSEGRAASFERKPDSHHPGQSYYIISASR